MEASGTVEVVGPDVTDVKPGDRVAYAMNRGSYAEYAVVPAATLVKLPDHVSFEMAAAAMLQGMTAHYLTHSTFPLKSGDTCLIHAAAGGVGRLAVQMAKMLGARVIGTAGDAAKVALARSAGADEVINYTEQDFLPEVKRLTDGRGVDVVYDSVGVATFLRGLDCIRTRGMMVLFGQSSGPVAPIDPNILNPKGSLFLTRPNLAPHCATRRRVELGARVMCSVGSPPEKTGASHRPGLFPWPRPRKRIATSRDARPQGKCSLSPDSFLLCSVGQAIVLCGLSQLPRPEQHPNRRPIHPPQIVSRGKLERNSAESSRSTHASRNPHTPLPPRAHSPRQTRHAAE